MSSAEKQQKSKELDADAIRKQLRAAFKNLPEKDIRIMHEVQAMTRKYVPEGVLLSEELLADRRKENK